jgi:hypothetical protein
VVAAALAGIPEADRPYVSTKGGLVWNPADRSAAPRRVGNPASLRAEVEALLRRLRVERIDLYQMHWSADDGTPVEEYWQVFTDLKRQGKIRAAGLSNHDICQLEAAESVGNVDAIQPPFNLIHRVTGPIVGARSPRQLKEDDLADIAALGTASGRPLPERSATPGHWKHSPSACCPFVSGGTVHSAGVSASASRRAARVVMPSLGKTW